MRYGTFPPNKCRKCGLIADHTRIPIGSLTFEDGSFWCGVCPETLQPMVDLLKESKAKDIREAMRIAADHFND